MKQRLQYIDVLRGFTISLVVLGHVLEHARPKDGFSSFNYWQGNFGYICDTFHSSK